MYISRENYKKDQTFYVYQTKTQRNNRKDYIVPLMIV